MKNGGRLQRHTHTRGGGREGRGGGKGAKERECETKEKKERERELVHRRSIKATYEPQTHTYDTRQL